MISIKKSISSWFLAKLRPSERTEAGSRWKEIGHHTLLATLKQEAEERGWTVGIPQIYLSKGETDMALSVDVSIPDIIPPEQMSFSVGLRNSNSQRSKILLYAGVRIEEPESVGIPLLEIGLGKHQEGLDLPKRMADTLAEVEEEIGNFWFLLLSLRTRKVPMNEAEQLLSEACRRGDMPWSRRRFIDELFLSSPQTAWDLLYLFARAARMNPPLLQMKQIHDFYRLLKNKEES